MRNFIASLLTVSLIAVSLQFCSNQETGKNQTTNSTNKQIKQQNKQQPKPMVDEHLLKLSPKGTKFEFSPTGRIENEKIAVPKDEPGIQMVRPSNLPKEIKAGKPVPPPKVHPDPMRNKRHRGKLTPEEKALVP